MDFYLLQLLVLLPLVAGALCALTAGKTGGSGGVTGSGGGIGTTGGGGVARAIALTTGLLHLALGGFAATRLNWNTGADQLGTVLFGFEFPLLGFSLRLGADPLSLLLTLATSLLATCAIAASFGSSRRSEGAYYGWLMVLMSALTGVWLARDLLLFYAFFELILVPLFFLIGTFGGPDRRQAAAKLFIFTFTGSILALPAILYVGLGAKSFDLATAIVHAQQNLSSTERFWVLMGLLASFSVKTPLFPLHTWQPSAMAESPGNGVVDCSGLVLKLGAFAILKIALPIGLLDGYGGVSYPRTLVFVAVLAVIGTLYGALCAWAQTDMKRLLAYSSLSHVGYVVLGFLALNGEGMQGAGFYLLSTAITTGALFLLVGMIYDRFATRDMADLSGLGKTMPLMAFFFGLFTMASIGLPLLSGFVAEFLTIIGTFKSAYLGITFGVLAALGMVLGAIYMLGMAARILFGPVKVPNPTRLTPTPTAARGDLNFREVTLLTPLALIVLVLGIYPTPVLNTLRFTMDSVIKTDIVVRATPPPNPSASHSPPLTSAQTPELP